jgi:hypothetical protein
MRNGVYFTDFQVDGVSPRGIVAAEDGLIRGFDRRYFYFINRAPDEPPRYMAPKRHGKAVIYGTQSVDPSGRSFGILIREIEDADDWFIFRGSKDGDPNSAISIQGARVYDLP